MNIFDIDNLTIQHDYLLSNGFKQVNDKYIKNDIKIILRAECVEISTNRGQYALRDTIGTNKDELTKFLKRKLHDIERTTNEEI